jgi:ferritin-like metal-binding protein YciE
MSNRSAKGLRDIFLDGLKDIYYAEKKILNALRTMAEDAESEKVAEAFEKHREQTHTQVERLERIFAAIGKPPRGKTCPAIDGIIEEGSAILFDYKGAPALDAGLLGAAQAVEHYEIARYGTLIAWAEHLRMTEVLPLLRKTLQEEIETDEALTKLGEQGVNERAMQDVD